MKREYFTIAAIVIAACLIGFASYRVGYSKGYSTAYDSEHSHYVFEKKRADVFASRISTQKRCVDKMAKSVDPVAGVGFFAIAETMRQFSLLYWGTVRCDQDSSFGFVTQEQFRRIIPASN